MSNTKILLVTTISPLEVGYTLNLNNPYDFPVIIPRNTKLIIDVDKNGNVKFIFENSND